MVSKGNESGSACIQPRDLLLLPGSQGSVHGSSKQSSPHRISRSSQSKRSQTTPTMGQFRQLTPPHRNLSPLNPPHGSLTHHLPGYSRFRLDDDEVQRVSEEKKKEISPQTEASWKEAIRRQMEEDLAQRVRDALETPPLEKMARRRRELMNRQISEHPEIERLNAQFVHELELEEHQMKKKNWKSWRANRLMRKMMALQASQSRSNFDVIFKDELSRSNHASFPGVFGLDTMSEGMKDYTPGSAAAMSLLDKSLRRQASTKAGFLQAIRNGRFLDGSSLNRLPDGTYVDKYGVVRTEDGPFWPLDAEPLFPTPRFKWDTVMPTEPYSMATRVANQQTVDNQQTPYTGKWRGVLNVYDSERSPRDHTPVSVPEECAPSLQFESRFECGNLRQARRIGQFDYELVLKTDMYTSRHTQWFYFRVQNAVPGATYRFRIVNFLKKDSLYNHGMRPLMYSDKDALTKNVGWLRTGHHISYSRNVSNLHCPLLLKGVTYYMLEWQMEFTNGNDTCYLAHCYPYTFTDLREDVDEITRNNNTGAKCLRKEVLCETRAGNSCFLLTVSDFNVPDTDKKAVVITGRVHPGESNASWMMKGVVDFITSSDPTAKELRKKFIFKIVPMLNPDGVIVGNYRCSLAARDLNRNYRHPRKDNFPTVWSTKEMIETIAQEREIALYCDLHGHSRKHNVFMYGNNTGEDDQGVTAAKSFLNERLFPWLMSNKSPEKFTFEGCKFAIRRCKESTGRVVMWRQMRVLNSFTLEATFSGTTINKSGTRHFNTLDFREMGESLVRVVGDYQMLQEDPRLHAMVIQQLTRYITRQILQSRGFAMGKFQMLRQNLPREPHSVKQEVAAAEAVVAVETDKDGKVAESLTDILVTAYYGEAGDNNLPQEKQVEDLTSLLRTPNVLRRCHGHANSRPNVQSENPKQPSIPSPPAPPAKKVQRNGSQSKSRTAVSVAKATTSITKVTESFLRIVAGEDNTASSSDQEKTTSPRLQEDNMWKSDETINTSTDIDDVTELCDAITPETMDDCLDFLGQLNVRRALQESDSSDSDSESEPEMKPHESKKKKKRRSKKQRDKDRQKREPSPKKTSSDDFRPKTITPKDVFKPETTAQLLKLDKIKGKEPLYISKYEGRHNHGIPCFAEERSLERAAKRMAEVKKRKDDTDKESSYLLPGVTPYQNFMAIVRAGDLQRAATQDDIRQRLRVALHEGTPNVAQTLVGFEGKTAFSNPDELVQISNIQPFSANPSPTNKKPNRYTSSSDESEVGLDPQYLFQGHGNRDGAHNNNNGNLTSERRATVPQMFNPSSAPATGSHSRSVASQQLPNHYHHIYKHLFSNGQTDRLSDKRLQAYRTGSTSLLVTTRLKANRRSSAN